MRNPKHLRCAGQHTSKGSSACVFLQKFWSFGEGSVGESVGL